MAEEDKTNVPNAMTPPTYGSYEWNDYVVSFLKDQEMTNGNPNTDALRRLVELLIGEIIETKTHIIQAPNPENLNRAVVTATISISVNRSDKSFTRMSYQGSADSDSRNTDSPYNMFPTAMAETRALARAYRQALRIRTNAAEEMSVNADNMADIVNNDIKITGTQIKAVDKMCSSLDINVEKLINAGELKYSKINEVSINKGTLIMKTLTEFKNKVRQIPEVLLGYEKDWQNTFNKQT